MALDRVGRGIAHAISTLWRNWAYGLGVITIVNLLTIYVSKDWLPLIVFCFALMLYSSLRMNMTSDRPSCGRFLYVCDQTLFWSAIVMVVINVLSKRTALIESFSVNPINERIPYITVLVWSTIGTIVAIWTRVLGRDHHFCRSCSHLYGSKVERGFVGKMYSQEGQFQLNLAIGFFATLAIVDWTYYFFFYVNVNINSPDRLFFFFFPTALYIISLFVLGLRYFSLWAYYNRVISGSPIGNGPMTVVRYLIVCGDEIFVTVPVEDAIVANADEDRIDTPARLNMSFRERITDYDADDYFKAITDITPAKMRFLYSNDGLDTGCSIFHFAAILDDTEVMEKSRCQGRWMSLGTIQRYSAEGKVSPRLISEIDRIYRSTMAWKSYDRRGYRLYDIKNYKPVFRLRDLPNWDIDFNDPVWLFVADNNEDRSFFRIRRLWRKFVTGTSE